MTKTQKAPLGYSGKIGNAGSQKVEAPFAPKATAKGTVKKGKDLEKE
ncbi:MAG TPA: hypothetical protein PKD52_01065 [Clostridiales bacterium]|nr:hypothetical protein [Clostridiales bacterium]